MFQRTLLFLGLTIVASCASFNSWDPQIDRRIIPPELIKTSEWEVLPIQDIMKLTDEDLTINEQWLKKYTLARRLVKENPTESCRLYEQLSQENQFPLSDLAQLRAYEICDHFPRPTTVTQEYRSLFAEIDYQKSLATSTIDDDLPAAIEKINYELDRKNKETLILQTIQLAQKLQRSEVLPSLQIQLYKNSPRLKPTYTDNNERNLAASDFRFHRQFSEALKIYDQIFKNKNSTIEEQYQALKNIRNTYKVSQDKANYIKSSEQWAQFSLKTKSVEKIHEAYLTYAKALWTENQTSIAIQKLNELEKILSKKYSLEEVYYTLGRIEEESGRYLEAIDFYNKSENESNTNGIAATTTSDIADKRNWQKSWLQYKMGQYNETQLSLKKIVSTTQDSSEKFKALFWLSKVYNKLDLNNERDELLNQLEDEDILGYYGVLARRERNRHFDPLNGENLIDKKHQLYILKTIPAATRIKAEWLISTSEIGIALKYLYSIESDLRKLNTTDSSYWFALYFAYARAGQYNQLFQWIARTDNATKLNYLKKYPQVIFPTNYKKTIEIAAQKTRLPKEYVYSIIRQESAFNPFARSSADAFGLMQILPTIAKLIADQNNIPYKEAQDLYQPDTNITIGSLLLRRQLDKYQERYVLSTASYNASENAIAGWLKLRYREDVLEFIEEVPYEETRNYIKLVLRNYVFYSRQFSNESVLFPEFFFNWSTFSN